MTNAAGDISETPKVDERPATSLSELLSLTSSARAAFDQKDWTKAIKLWSDVCTLAPANGEAFYHLGLAQEHLRRLEEAEETLSVAVAIDASDIDYNIAYNRVADRRRVREASAEVWAKFCDDYPVAFKVHKNAIFAALTKEDFQTADAAYDVALDRFGRSDDIISLSIEILAQRVRSNALGLAGEARFLECLQEEPPDELFEYIPKLLWSLVSWNRTERPIKTGIGELAKKVMTRSDIAAFPRVNLDLICCYFNIDRDDAPLRDLKIEYLLKLHRFKTHFVYQGFYTSFDRDIVREWLMDTVASNSFGRFDENVIYKLFLIAMSLDREVCASFCRSVDRTFSHLPADVRTPMGTVLNACRLRAAADEHVLQTRDLPAPSVVQKRLKIALCISGQLRGYKSAWKSWRGLKFDDHETDVYVHVWEKIGRKFPSRPMAHEVFSGAFLVAYRSVLGSVGKEAFEALYPGFMNFFRSDDKVTAAELKSYYKTDHVIVEDEDNGALAGMPNSAKMYYKADACFKFASATGAGYDLFVRIRPDFHIKKLEAWDWNRVQKTCRSERSIIVECRPKFGDWCNYQMADQFAVGEYDTMSIFTGAYTLTKHAQSLGLYSYPRDYTIHDNFGWATLYGGIHVTESKEFGLHFALPFDADKIDLADMRLLLLADMGGTPRQDEDKSLLKAIESDIEKAGPRG
ncbi:MAG: tetratricopeptide repeat protein [Alphaproteobacteria bacterium]|nr:tetratricopeptide repeat protein [Alphaproteobacteria bacterium]